MEIQIKFVTLPLIIVNIDMTQSMGVIIGLALIFVFLLYQLYKERKDEKKAEEQRRSQLMRETGKETKDMEEKDMEEKKQPSEEPLKEVSTRELICDTITKMGCQYTVGEDDEKRIFFSYQGEHFMVEAEDGKKFIHLYDTFWEQVELYDVEKFSRLRKVINLANLNSAVTTVYTINEEAKVADVHCKMSLLLVPEIPHIEAYFRSVLDSFFYVHRFIGAEMAKLETTENAK